MSKKNTIAIVVILIVVAILGVVGYYVLSSNLWSEDGEIEDGHQNLINETKAIEDYEERKEQVNQLLEEKFITQAEADEILGK